MNNKKIEGKLKKLREKIDSEEIPELIDIVIEKNITVDRGDGVMKKFNLEKRMKYVLGAATAVVVAFGIGINSSATFAEGIYKIPILGDVAKIITIRDYSFTDDISHMEVEVPSVEISENLELQDKINKIINEKVDETILQQKKLDEEYKEAYLETGGDEESFKQIETTVDYSIKSTEGKYLSFVISKNQSLANAYDENYYYNYDLNSGKELLLADMLGDDFERIIREEVSAQIENNIKEGINVCSLEDLENTNINENRKFYINEDGDVVVVFDKYEIAPGSAGIQEFVIKEK